MQKSPNLIEPCHPFHRWQWWRMYYKKWHDTVLNMTPVDDDLMIKMLSVLAQISGYRLIFQNIIPKYLIYNIVPFDSNPTWYNLLEKQNGQNQKWKFLWKTSHKHPGFAPGNHWASQCGSNCVFCWTKIQDRVSREHRGPPRWRRKVKQRTGLSEDRHCVQLQVGNPALIHLVLVKYMVQWNI